MYVQFVLILCYGVMLCYDLCVVCMSGYCSLLCGVVFGLHCNGGNLSCIVYPNMKWSHNICMCGTVVYGCCVVWFCNVMLYIQCGAVECVMCMLVVMFWYCVLCYVCACYVMCTHCMCVYLSCIPHTYNESCMCDHTHAVTHTSGLCV